MWQDCLLTFRAAAEAAHSGRPGFHRAEARCFHRRRPGAPITNFLSPLGCRLRGGSSWVLFVQGRSAGFPAEIATTGWPARPADVAGAAGPSQGQASRVIRAIRKNTVATGGGGVLPSGVDERVPLVSVVSVRALRGTFPPRWPPCSRCRRR